MKKTKQLLCVAMAVICLIMTALAINACAACSHSWQLVESEGADCKGYTSLYVCSKCYQQENRTTAPTAAHKWVETAYVEKTCLKDGYASYFCQVCLDLKTETLKAPGSHDYSFVSNNNATCTKDGTKMGTCKRCNNVEILPDEGSAKGHSYDDKWVVTLEGTCLREGVSRRYCKNCNASEVRYDGYGPHADKDQDYKCDLCKADLTPEGPASSGSPDNAVTDCSCKCHKTGIANFFWKIGNFFAKLFKIKSKQICSCGVYHF